jgi:hypothetical protein
MNYSKIQDILAHDAKFGPSAAHRDTKVPTRSGEVVYSALTIQVAEAIEATGMSDKNCSRATVLAFATRISLSQPVGAGAPVLPPKKIESPETIVVRPAPASEVKLSPEKVQQKVQQADLAQFIAKGDILKFQGAVAIGQLMAAIYQLAEGDCWEGNERRRELLNELMESYEAVSKRHVNFSVKQIIRAKAEEQLRSVS